MNATPHLPTDYCGGQGFKPSPDALAAGICDVCGKRVKLDWAGRIPRHLKKRGPEIVQDDNGWFWVVGGKRKKGPFATVQEAQIALANLL